MNTKAQTIIEYVLLIGIVALVLFTMGRYIQRSVQAVVKVTADEIGIQENSEQDFEEETGYLDRSVTNSQASTQKDRIDRLYETTYLINESSSMDAKSVTNIGRKPFEVIKEEAEK